MKKLILLGSLLASSSLLLTPAWATTRSNSEKLQNKMDNYEVDLTSMVDDLTDAQNLDLEDDSVDNADYQLALLKYTAAYPILADAVVRTQQILSVTQYINSLPQKDKKAIRLTFQNLIAQIQTYQNDMVDDLALAADEDTESTGLNAVEGDITDARNYISSNKRDPHNTIEDYLKNYDNNARLDYEDTLDTTLDTYDLYKVLFSADDMKNFKTRFTNANAFYSDGVALYYRGISAQEDRDLQLLNRAAKKYKKVRYWLKLTNDAVSTLSVQL